MGKVTINMGEESTPESGSRVGFCTRLGREFRGLYSTTDTGGRKLDIAATFSMHRKPVPVLIKFVFASLAISALVDGWITSKYPWFYPAYLTRWGLIISIVYLLLSLLLSFGCKSAGVIKVAWLLFSVSAVLEVIITVFYWSMAYVEGVESYDSIMAHGVVLVLVLIDGLIINRTPVRLLHWLVTFLVSLLYMSWSLIHAYVIEDNPYRDAGEDDGIYRALDWKNDLVEVLILTMVTLFAISPFLHFILWAVSLPGRRFEPETKLALPDDKKNPEQLTGV